jgi:hypothetical protein
LPAAAFQAAWVRLKADCARIGRPTSYEWRNTAWASTGFTNDTATAYGERTARCQRVVPVPADRRSHAAGERLLESEEVGDNVIAILTRLRDHRGAVRQIVERIAGLPASEREIALPRLSILAGLRRLAKTVEQEARKMPIHIDIPENEVLGPVF